VSATKRRGTWRPPCPDPGVQARVVIDAIVSNKTFANATVPVTGGLIFDLTNCQNASNATTCFEIFKKISRGRSWTLPLRAQDRLDQQARSLFVQLHPLRCAGERGDTSFLPRRFGIPSGSCYLRKTLRRALCGGAYLVCSGRRSAANAAGAWSNR
jgi:hypothetical protein